MKVLESASSFKSWRSEVSGDVGFVPTMGALHKGHLSLIEKSMSQNTKTCVSIFVNPTQFNNADDLENYPRTLEDDLNKISGIDAVYTPTIEDIYPQGYLFGIHENQFSKILEGAHRPGHFQGMMTIVMKLLLITQPTRAYFGEKDFQQLLLVEKMTKDFFLNTEIIACPIVREADGLAMSSRNVRLSDTERQKAPKIYEQLNSEKSLQQIREDLTKEGFEVEYIVEWQGRRLIAAHLGNVRLIDNVKTPTR